MGRLERRELASRLAVLIGHLLKLEVQTNRTPSNENSWRITVKAQRTELRRLLDQNPGLKNPALIGDALQTGWSDGLDLAARETGLPEVRFPDHLPYSVDQQLDDRFRP